MRLHDHDVNVPKNWGGDLIYKEYPKVFKPVDLMQRRNSFTKKKEKKRRDA